MYLRSPSISHWTKPPVPQTPMTLPKRTPSLKQLPQPSTPVKDIRNSTRTIFSPRLCPATQQANFHTASSPFAQCRTLQIPQVGLTNQLGCQAKNDVNNPAHTAPLLDNSSGEVWGGFSHSPLAQRPAKAHLHQGT
jgi:hypothetical protein